MRLTQRLVTASIFLAQMMHHDKMEQWPILLNYIEQRKVAAKKYTLYDSIYMKSKTGETHL